MKTDRLFQLVGSNETIGIFEQKRSAIKAKQKRLVSAIREWVSSPHNQKKRQTWGGFRSNNSQLCENLRNAEEIFFLPFSFQELQQLNELIDNVFSIVSKAQQNPTSKCYSNVKEACSKYAEFACGVRSRQILMNEKRIERQQLSEKKRIERQQLPQTKKNKSSTISRKSRSNHNQRVDARRNTKQGSGIVLLAVGQTRKPGSYKN